MGQMNKPLFDVDRADLQVTLNKIQPGTGFAWQTLFPLRYTRRFDLKGIEGNEGLPVSANRVAFNTAAPIKTREKVGTWSGKLAKIAVSRVKDEEDINDYEELRILAQSNDNAQDATELINYVYDDVDFCAKSMDARVELDAMGIGSLGKQTFKSAIEGDIATDDEIDFNIQNKSGVAKPWTKVVNGAVVIEDTADGLKDIIDAQDKIAKQGLAKPMFCIMEKSAYNALRAQKAVANRLFPQAKDLTLVTADMISLQSINAYMTANGFPQIVVIDTYVRNERKDGTYEVIKPWNENVVTLSPTLQLGWTYYKPVNEVANTDAMQAQGAYYKTTIYSQMNPSLEVTMAEAYVQPALINRRSLVMLNTANKAWNEGER